MVRPSLDRSLLILGFVAYAALHACSSSENASSASSSSTDAGAGADTAALAVDPACTALAQAYASTCAAKVVAALSTCFQAVGACTYTAGTPSSSASVTWASGAKEVVDSSNAANIAYIGPNGATCLTQHGTFEDAAITNTYSVPSGETYNGEAAGGALIFHCANGEETTLTAADQETYKACFPRSGSCTGGSSASFPNVGSACTDNSSCFGGAICCTAKKVCVLSQQDCDNL